jgi:hypothetical protein
MLYDMSNIISPTILGYAFLFKQGITGIILAFTGDDLRKLEKRGVVIRFVIGRRFFQKNSIL